MWIHSQPSSSVFQSDCCINPLPSYISTVRCSFRLMHNMHQYASIGINMLQSASIPLPSYFSTGRCYFSLMHNMHQYASIPYLVTSRQMRLQTQCTQCSAHRPGHGVPTSKNFEHVKCLICEPASCHIFICQ